MQFSIIVATFNSALTIGPMLRSISNQTFDDFELIIVDNKSTDNTIEMVTEEFSKAKVVSEADTGIYNALNKGLALAKGEWVYVIGSDDILASSSVLEEVNNKILEHKNLGLIYGDIEAKNYSGCRRINMPDRKSCDARKFKCPPIFHQSAFVRRDLFKRLGQFPELLDIHADYFIVSGAFNCAESAHINTVICVYNQSGYSANSFSNFLRSTRQLLTVNLFFGERLSTMILTTCKNCARMIFDSTRQILGRYR